MISLPISLTDIKPPVFHRMMAERREELNEHVLGELKDNLDSLKDKEFKRKLKNTFHIRLTPLKGESFALPITWPQIRYLKLYTIQHHLYRA